MSCLVFELHFCADTVTFKEGRDEANFQRRCTFYAYQVNIRIVKYYFDFIYKNWRHVQLSKISLLFSRNYVILSYQKGKREPL